MMRPVASLLPLFLVANAWAIVNVEAIRPTLEGKSHEITLTGFFIFRSGNVNQIQLEADGGVAFRTGNHIFFTLGNIAFGIEKGERFLNETFAHIRWNWDRYRVIPEVFLQYEFNEFLSLRTRAVAGTGPRIKIFDEDEFSVFWGSSFMLEWEVLTEGTPQEVEGILYYRINNYLSLWWRGERVDVGLVVYAQPRVDVPSDIRGLAQGDLSVKVTEIISFTLSLSARLDTVPPEGVKPLDIEIKNGITFSF